MYKTEHPLYGTYTGMIARCYHENNSKYGNYGSRGIRVCSSWLNDFWQFASDMGPKPSPTHTVDRIDNDGPYSPENCRWATRREQATNKRTNRIVTINEVSHPITVWCEIFEVSHHADAISMRIHRGWPPYIALTTPIGMSRTMATSNVYDNAVSAILDHYVYQDRNSRSDHRDIGMRLDDLDHRLRDHHVKIEFLRDRLAQASPR